MKTQKQKTRKMNIRAKILMPVLIIILIVSAGMGGMMYLIGHKAYVEAGVEQSHLAATIASSLIDGSKIRNIHEQTADQDLYEKMLWELRDIKETCGILYMYTIYEKDGQVYYGIDTDDSEGQC